MQPGIPPEQLDRIQPIVDELSSGLRRLTSELPFDAESALVFCPGNEGQS
jgi:hypothetical protein